MIELISTNGQYFFVNQSHIRYIETQKDGSVIFISGGDMLFVKQSANEVVQLINDYLGGV